MKKLIAFIIMLGLTSNISMGIENHSENKMDAGDIQNGYDIEMHTNSDDDGGIRG
ncbi:hypothetical protein [Sporosalibacterium faouarense]|uniref:hypothetical protein n=1 Tax=Sporosalibacterium faouarense TaxID=516123 RepID=UPI00192C7801|nr:hypothetical protein [Sporosalibacterium faouarense]